MATPDTCAVATERYFDKRRWLNLWTLLLWVFGVTVILFCCAAILLFITQTWLAGALTVLGTIVNGAGVGWVVTQRTTAEKEERDAFKVFTDTCGPSKGGVAAVQGFIRPVPSRSELTSMAWKSLFSSLSLDQLLRQ